MINIPPPNKKANSGTKGLPPSVDEKPTTNLKVPATSDLVPLQLAINPEIKKELKIMSAETGIPMVQILLDGYQLWKEKNGHV